jgi:methyl-accepting chemotaxis protein
MKIGTKRRLFYLAVLGVFCLTAFALAADLQSVSDGYNAVLKSPVRQMEDARVVQLNFKKQVQEWKDILLRGHNPEDLAKYTKQFHEKEETVRAGAKALTPEVENAQTRQLLEQIQAAHAALSQKYQASYDVYLAGNADFKAADKLVRGQDRAPTDLFDQVVQRLGDRAKESVTAQTKAALDARNLAFAISGGLLALLAVAGFPVVWDILGRLGRLKLVSDRLARADISSLAVDVSGKDEISEFGGSLKGVHAAVEELMRLVSAKPAVKS